MMNTKVKIKRVNNKLKINEKGESYNINNIIAGRKIIKLQ